ncbi:MULTISPECIES: VanZ family protein [unclassified Curtobacterium]|uniref:VanZ family protein n=1 Tax=unclassified Curtobacterium TaxID=257496 RepID=UPI0037FE5FEB
MITTFLVNHATAVRVLFWVVVVVFALIGFVVHRLGARRVLVALTAVSLVAALALALTMTPAGEGGNGVVCTVQFSVPFRGIDTLANVALLFPVTLFAALLTGRPVAVLTAASGLSAAIELVQALLPALGRACDTNDWFMNSVGAVLGGVVAAGIVVVERDSAAAPCGRPGRRSGADCPHQVIPGTDRVRVPVVRPTRSEHRVQVESRGSSRCSSGECGAAHARVRRRFGASGRAGVARSAAHLPVVTAKATP